MANHNRIIEKVLNEIIETEEIIQDNFEADFIQETPKNELRKRAIGILLSQLAEYEVDTILEIAAVACDESNWSEVARSLRHQAREINEDSFRESGSHPLLQSNNDLRD